MKVYPPRDNMYNLCIKKVYIRFHIMSFLEDTDRAQYGQFLIYVAS